MGNRTLHLALKRQAIQIPPFQGVLLWFRIRKGRLSDVEPERKPTGKRIFQVAISKDSARRLEELAGAAGMSPEQFLRASVEEWLSHSRPAFSEAVSYVLSKNAELYRRLRARSLLKPIRPTS
jgi:hypothetical protein